MIKKRGRAAVFLHEAVISYLGGECVECGKKTDLDIHHVIPFCYGGLNSLGNMELLCESCHNKTTNAFHSIYNPSKNNLRTSKHDCKFRGCELIPREDGYCSKHSSYYYKKRKINFK